jgi:non-ribosomal peptide synthetase component F
VGRLSALEELECRQRQVDASDVVNLQFTSGTTGLPKGAMLTHDNLLMNAYYVGQRLRYTAEDRVCVPVPFYHCFGCVLGNLVCAVHGATIGVPAPAFDPGATLAALEAERCTSVYGVPTMFVGMLEHPHFASRDLSSLRTGIMSGAPCPLPLMEKVVNRMVARDLHRLRPDGGVADHHIHLGRRPDRGSLRDRRPADPRSRGEAGGPGNPGRFSAGRGRRARRPRPRRDGRLLQESRGVRAGHRS